ncbi:hypothetical protein HYC85_028034 [Camellia sinensis]|uniref:Uncharacterized protein n=1 Tax=Camellia sinensis TaxID=4442 RepID=A0A7J7FTZ0_CAMSI|nr:hypothetical protein HYC85_028034 [Camellia sinensis]
MGALGKWLKSLIGLKKTQSRHQENVGSSGKGRKWRLWRSDKGGHVIAKTGFEVIESSSEGTSDFLRQAGQEASCCNTKARVRASCVSAQSRDKPAIALEDEEKENPDSLVQEMMDDEAAKHEPTIEDDVSIQNQHL